MPRLSLHHLVVAFLLRTSCTTSLDLLARVSVLEGIAGKPPGAWMRNVIPERDIVDVFGPAVQATWSSNRDSGLVVAVRRSLEPLLRNTSESITQKVPCARPGDREVPAHATFGVHARLQPKMHSAPDLQVELDDLV